MGDIGGQKRRDFSTRALSRGALIAALYAVLTMAAYPLSFGAVQCRLSEALCVLPVFFPEAVWGLFVGCAVANILTPNLPLLDVVFGSAATLLAAFISARMRPRALAVMPPVVINAVVIGAVITLTTVGAGEGFFTAYALNALSVGVGELISCCVLGLPLMAILEKTIKKGNLK